MDRGPSGLQSRGHKELDTTELTFNTVTKGNLSVASSVGPATTRKRVTHYLFTHGHWSSPSQHIVLCNMTTPGLPRMLFSDPQMIASDKCMSSREQ